MDGEEEGEHGYGYVEPQGFKKRDKYPPRPLFTPTVLLTGETLLDRAYKRISQPLLHK